MFKGKGYYKYSDFLNEFYGYFKFDYKTYYRYIEVAISRELNFFGIGVYSFEEGYYKLSEALANGQDV